MASILENVKYAPIVYSEVLNQSTAHAQQSGTLLRGHFQVLPLRLEGEPKSEPANETPKVNPPETDKIVEDTLTKTPEPKSNQKLPAQQPDMVAEEVPSSTEQQNKNSKQNPKVTVEKVKGGKTTLSTPKVFQIKLSGDNSQGTPVVTRFSVLPRLKTEFVHPKFESESKSINIQLKVTANEQKKGVRITLLDKKNQIVGETHVTATENGTEDKLSNPFNLKNVGTTVTVQQTNDPTLSLPVTFQLTPLGENVHQGYSVPFGANVNLVHY